MDCCHFSLKTHLISEKQLLYGNYNSMLWTWLYCIYHMPQIHTKVKRAWMKIYPVVSRNFSDFTGISLLYSNTMFACLFVCSRPISSGTAGPIWLNFFLLAPSWPRDGFRPKKFRIRDPVFPKIRKNPVFRVLFAQFGWNFQELLTLTQICFKTNKFLDRVSGFSGKIRQNLAKIRFNSILWCDTSFFIL